MGQICQCFSPMPLLITLPNPLKLFFIEDFKSLNFLKALLRESILYTYYHNVKVKNKKQKLAFLFYIISKFFSLFYYLNFLKIISLSLLAFSLPSLLAPSVSFLSLHLLSYNNNQDIRTTLILVFPCRLFPIFCPVLH